MLRQNIKFLSLSVLLALRALSSFQNVAVMAAEVPPPPDADEGCPHWAESGECDTNPNFMLQHCATSCAAVQRAALETERELANISSFYDLSAKDIDGNVVSFQEFQGRVVIIVNVASYCGYTESHYRGLVDLWSHVQHEPVEILAFPCNQFGAQEPKSNEEIKEFAAHKGVTFRMMDKIQVNGPNASIVYKYLKHAAGPANIHWNFATYFVVAPDGTITSHSGVEPMNLLDVALGLVNREEL